MRPRRQLPRSNSSIFVGVGEMKKLVPAFLLFLLFFCGPVHAFVLPDKPSSRIMDAASMFSSSEREKLETQLEAFERETSNQLVVVTVPALEGQPIEDFSIKLAEKWKIGTKEHDNGIILLFSKEDRAMRIEVGYGLEGVLPDALAKRIIENEIAPRFKQGDFDGGVDRGVDAIILATRGEYQGASAQGDDSGDMTAALFLLIPVLYVAAPVIAYFMLVLFMTVFFGAAGFGIGSLIALFLFWLRWKYLDSYFAKARTYSGSGRGGFYGGGFGGGGGFSGGFSGGGGSFGGGGASGRW